MALPYQPAVRIVLGYAARAEKPPATYVSPPTLALQKAVASMGKDWKRVAPMFVIAPAARSGRVVVGLAMSRAPMVLDAPRMIAPNTAIAKEHYVVQSHLGRGPDVDRYGNTQADDGILDALAAGADDPALRELGLVIEDRDAGPAHFLVSDDGRTGALVYGQVIWRLGEAYEGGTVRTWSRDYGGGEGVRLIGVPYAEVGPDAPLVRIDAGFEALDAHTQPATAAVRALLDTQAAWCWSLVSGDAPADAAPIAPVAKAPRAKKKKAAAETLADRFVVRPIAACVSALAAIEEGATTLAAQTVDVPGVVRAYSHEDLASPPSRAPDPALYELEAPEALLTDPTRLVKSPFASRALGMWNAHATGRWAHGEGWIALDVELVPEQADDAVDESVRAIVAVFAVEGGWAGVVWPSMRHEQVAKLLGFDPWARATWHECKLWLG